MNFSASAVEKRTASMSVFAQILTAVGIVVVIIGTFMAVWGALEEWVYVDDAVAEMSGLIRLMNGIGWLIAALCMSAIGATLHAIQAIAVNVAKISDTGD